MQSRIAISVVVPAFNAADTIGRTLEALARQDLEAAYEVIVVDDGSDDETAAIAAGAPGPVRLVRQARAGPGPARNRGVAESRSATLAFIDADCFPEPSWLREGIAALRDADLIQGRVHPDPQARLGPFDRTVWVARERGLFECANMFVTRSLFEAVGGFEDWLQARIGKPLAEDVWFGWRAHRARARIRFAPRAVVHHAVFRRTARQYVAERVRLVYFPAMAAKVPELRVDFFWARWFLSSRSASFDLALLGLAAGFAGTTLASPAAGLVPLAAAVPYVTIALRAAARWRKAAPRVALAGLAADAVALAALAAGSLRWRSLLL